MFALTDKVALYVPSTGCSSPAEEAAAEVAARAATASRLFSSLFGGSTAYEATGSWVDDTGCLINEAVTIVFSFATAEAKAAHANSLINVASLLCSLWYQDCISLEYDHRLLLVDRDDLTEEAEEAAAAAALIAEAAEAVAEEAEEAAAFAKAAAAYVLAEEAAHIAAAFASAAEEAEEAAYKAALQ